MPDEIDNDTQNYQEDIKEKESKAGVAIEKLRREIEELSDNQITAATAPFIVGLYLARKTEREKLTMLNWKHKKDSHL